MNKRIIKGSKYSDKRGILTFNNDFDASVVRRIYTIENHSTDVIRGWQGHKIEQRWFAAIKGAFDVFVVEIDDFDNPSKDLKVKKYSLDEELLTYLHIPAGCVTAIQAKVIGSKMLVLADYILGDVQDEYKFESNYFIELEA